MGFLHVFDDGGPGQRHVRSARLGGLMSVLHSDRIHGGTRYSRMQTIPTEKALGAEIQGIDVRKIHADEFESIYRALLDHQVLLFRAQQLTDEDLIAFSRRFGELDYAPIQESGRRFV